MERVLYIDILIITNFLIDFLLLRGVEIITGDRAHRLRLVAGALLSAASSLAIFLPPLPTVLMVLYKIAVACVVSVTVFGFVSVGCFLRNTLCFFFVSFVFGGTAYAVASVTSAGVTVNNMTFYFDSSPLFLISVISGVYIVIRSAFAVWRGRVPKKGTAKIIVKTPDNTKTLTAFVDTGHRLRDPNGAHVIILCDTAAAELLSERQTEAARMVSSGEYPAVAGTGIRIIPFSSVGGDGIMPAFPADWADVILGSKKIRVNRPVLAVSNKLPCSAVISEEMIRGIV